MSKHKHTLILTTLGDEVVVGDYYNYQKTMRGLFVQIRSKNSYYPLLQTSSFFKRWITKTRVTSLDVCNFNIVSEHVSVSLLMIRSTDHEILYAYMYYRNTLTCTYVRTCISALSLFYSSCEWSIFLQIISCKVM